MNPRPSTGDIRDADSTPRLEVPLEEGMATHSSILAWRIPWTEEPGKLQSIGLQSWTTLKWLSMHADRPHKNTVRSRANYPPPSRPYAQHPMARRSWGLPVWLVGTGTISSLVWKLSTRTSNPSEWFFPWPQRAFPHAHICSAKIQERPSQNSPCSFFIVLLPVCSSPFPGSQLSPRLRVNAGLLLRSLLSALTWKLSQKYNNPATVGFTSFISHVSGKESLFSITWCAMPLKLLFHIFCVFFDCLR